MARCGRFVIKKVGEGYMFELQASNYSPIAESPVYATFHYAKRAIRSIMENAHSVPVQDNTTEEVVKYPNPKFEIFRQENYFFFRYRAANGKMTLSSQVYTSIGGCRNGVDSVQINVKEANICLETPSGIMTLEEYAATGDRSLTDGEDPTAMGTDTDDVVEEVVAEEEKSTRPGRFVIFKDDKGFRFELLAANFQAIADSPTYSTLDSVKRSIRSIKEYACGVPVQDNTVSEIEKQPNPKFEIFGDDGEFHFRFRAKNGKQTISSRVYATKEGCKNGVDSVQKHVEKAEIYIETDDGTIPIEEYTAIRVAIFNASVFKKKTSEEPAETETPVAEAAPVAPVAEEAPAAVEDPVVEEAPAVVEEPVAEEAPAVVEEPVAEEAPAAVEEPVAEETPAVEEPVAEEAPAVEEEPVTEEAPVAEPTVVAPGALPPNYKGKKPGVKNFLIRLFRGDKK